jgi:hypothetical protein
VDQTGAFSPGGIREKAMELVFTAIAVVGGMSFSLAVALLVEELIFGKVLGLFFVPRTSQVKAEQ